MRQCEVYLHGIKTGVLTENDSHEYKFTYDKAYLLNENCDAVSLTLPLRSEPYYSETQVDEMLQKEHDETIKEFSGVHHRLEFVKEKQR